ncbi:DNA damage-regulated autophagy modulator protein 2 [Nilaparvata lugens]|uniref:DNA damage-regulated autophagy modulator protein 2 n=1 Tax=Nilaparvata lugens TaxID=108931 RepID=UPI000B99D13F|nr:DNA damage-regulated autophagy modulator protein 2 [Nilaparvata lugens]
MVEEGGVAGAVSHLHWLPVIIFLWMPLSFLTTYLIAVEQDHVYPLFPAISDTGALPPESCVFSLLVNILALLLTFAVWLRGKQLRHAPVNIGPSKLVNTGSSFLGYLACFGLYLVANCQETNTLVFHFVGALTAFWSSFFYCLTQTIFSYWLINEMNSAAIFIARAILCFAQLFLNVFTFCTLFVAVSLFKGNGGIVRSLKWSPADPGWAWHVAGTISEWLLAGSVGLFVLTYSSDFKRLTLHPPKVKLIGYKYDDEKNGSTYYSPRSEIPLDTTTRI